MDQMLLDSFVRLLDDASPPPAVRAVEAGGPAETMWTPFRDSGFLDALVAETQGGAGLDLREMAPLFLALGAHATPLPVAETMVARALLGMETDHLPDGPVLLADMTAGHGGLIPSAAHATLLLADDGDRLRLFALADVDIRDPGLHAGLNRRIAGLGAATPLAEVERPAAGLRALAAILRAALIAGASARVLEMTVAYAAERTQFGKPIGKQQAIQQTLAVMAERSVLAGMAARIGCADGLNPRLETAAIAKQVTSAAAAEIANMAHAVHGAIGISEEYDLQLLTRRLHEWRMAEGSESWWAGLVGERRLQSDIASSVDYIRTLEHR